MSDSGSGKRYPRQNYQGRGGGSSHQGSNQQNPGNVGKPRQVSSNYTVDLFHHQIGSHNPQQGGQSRYGGSQGAGGRTQRPFHQRSGAPSYGGRPRVTPTVPRESAKKGYTHHTFELKNDLYSQFMEKLKVSSKTPKEVINQLISFYNMDKIKI